MRALVSLIAPSLALLAAAPALAAPNALLLKSENPWGFSSLEAQLISQGIVHTRVSSADFAAEDLSNYTMLLVASCQPDAVYTAWNDRSGDIDAFASAGGFVAIHGAVNNCGSASGSIFPQPPGGDVTWNADLRSSGINVATSDPLMVGVPALPTGNMLTYTMFTSTGNMADIPQIVAGGNSGLFRRTHGTGNVVVGGLGYEIGYANGEDAGTVMVNEVRWGALVGCLDTDVDSDGDGVCDGNDVCGGFDDMIDTDLDGLPDACDVCPFSAVVNADVDQDGVDNSCDNCPMVPNSDQRDVDFDGIGDVCDNCVNVENADQFDWDDDGQGDVCDSCEFGANDQDTDGDGVADDCDACPFDALDDSDGDGVCDSSDACEGVDDSQDADADGTPDACDNCPDVFNQPQNDRDGDGYGSGCDCDDRDVTSFPGGEEVCDGADNDCNGSTDDINGVVNQFYPDFDGDGVGEANVLPVEACEAPEGYSSKTGDCNDSDPNIFEGAIEYCDDVDNDCDGNVDGVRCTPISANCGGCSAVQGPLGSGFGLAFALVLLGLRRRR
ncbi:MAG: hypothetical protein GWP91_13800 [Rhodobacterales bacterium]|nr:hypothetical protein [Rhodobacterales bacterium]